MRGEKQGDSECLLATLADLTNTPLSRVRATALAFSGKKSWSEVGNVSNGDINSLWWKTIFYLCDIHDTTKKLAHVLVQACSIDTPEGRALSAKCVASTILPVDLKDLPSKGKGVIVLGTNDWKTGHIVPWQDGFAYDTNIAYNFGETLEVVKKRYGDLFSFVVRGISQL